VKPWELLGETRAIDGTLLALTRRDREYVILANGRSLMSSRMHGSEEALATIGCGHARRSARPCVLVGGLGMGFTLRAVLDLLPSDAIVTVAELVPAVIEWNREPLAALAAHPLRDSRVRIEVADVGFTLRASTSRFDAILLDVDNGPSPLAHPANERLYGAKGVRACRDALRAGGVLAVWSAGPDERYRERLEKAGLGVEVQAVPARSGTSKGVRHVVFLGVKPDVRTRAPRAE
jgi:spermidine synthase